MALRPVFTRTYVTHGTQPEVTRTSKRFGLCFTGASPGFRDMQRGVRWLAAHSVASSSALGPALRKLGAAGSPHFLFVPLPMDSLVNATDPTTPVASRRHLGGLYVSATLAGPQSAMPPCNKVLSPCRLAASCCQPRASWIEKTIRLRCTEAVTVRGRSKLPTAIALAIAARLAAKRAVRPPDGSSQRDCKILVVRSLHPNLTAG